jgi:surfeit locus 1 family protein
VLAAALLGMAVTARLGWWQLDRAAQKTAIQAALVERRALPPLDMSALARTETAAQSQHHRSARLQGQWLPAHTVYLDNRQMQGRPGFYAITPLALPDGTAVLVQRGWLPRDVNDRTRVQAPLPPAGTVQVAGRIAPAPGRLYEFAPSGTGPIRQNLDLVEFGRETGLPLRPWTLVQGADPGEAPDGLQRDWPEPAAGLAKHHGYALQWFSLSALIVGLTLWFQMIQPLLARHREQPRA